MRRWQGIFFWAVVLWWAGVVWYVSATAWFITNPQVRALNALAALLAVAMVAMIRFYGYRPEEWRRKRWPVHVVSIGLGLAVVWPLFLVGLVEGYRRINDITRWRKVPMLHEDLWSLVGTLRRFGEYRPAMALRTAGLAAIVPAVLVGLAAVVCFRWYRRRADRPQRQFLRWIPLVAVHLALMTGMFYGGYELIRRGGDYLNMLGLKPDMDAYDPAAVLAAQSYAGYGHYVSGSPWGRFVYMPYGRLQFGARADGAADILYTEHASRIMLVHYLHLWGPWYVSKASVSALGRF